MKIFKNPLKSLFITIAITSALTTTVLFTNSCGSHQEPYTWQRFVKSAESEAAVKIIKASKIDYWTDAKRSEIYIDFSISNRPNAAHGVIANMTRSKNNVSSTASFLINYDQRGTKYNVDNWKSLSKTPSIIPGSPTHAQWVVFNALAEAATAGNIVKHARAAFPDWKNKPESAFTFLQAPSGIENTNTVTTSIIYNGDRNHPQNYLIFCTDQSPIYNINDWLRYGY